jgi:hypothetical protein
MVQTNPTRRHFLQTLAAAGTSLAVVAWAEEGLREPVFHIARAENVARRGDEHPLDPALRVAAEGLAHIQKDVFDYTCTIVKRERINGVLNEYEYMEAKIRNRKVKDGQIVVPLSVYLKFVQPKSIAGREVIWIEGKNNNKLVAHEGGPLLGRISVWLEPNSALAMRGNLYPITEIGIENLVAKLIERGSKDKQLDPSGNDTQVEFKRGAKLNKRLCTVLTVKHTVQKPQYDFEVAQIFIDEELNVPVRYIAYGWPDKPGGAQPVLEEYNYVNVKLNVELTDDDFDPKNPAYNFKGL